MNEQDAQVVAAVRQGDRERYRELIERYERLVYAVAWARLGDPHMAEEATQETFIKGYRRLGFLNHEGRFAAWIAAIARNVSINLGVRRRHELKKRNRWALEMESERAPDSSPPEEPISRETLRQTLAELPAQHRESLVLFYLEGKSIAESASILAISETAFKTRLHRARLTLREKLEARLEGSLERLGPSKPMAPAIMLLICEQSIWALPVGGVAGVLGKLFLTPLKLIPFHFFMLVAMLPGLLLSLWLSRIEERSFRDREGFRLRLYRLASRKGLLWTVCVLGLVLTISWVTAALEDGRRVYALTFVALMVGTSAVFLRQMKINRSRFVVGQLIAVVIMTFNLLGGAIAGAGWSQSVGWLFFGAFFALLAWSFRHIPLRMDYSLFLRSAMGLLPESVRDEKAASDRNLISRAHQFEFARFLGERFLVVGFREREHGLELRLAPARSDVFSGLPFLDWRWRNRSFITLRADGAVAARVGSSDCRNLDGLAERELPSRDQLEESVANTVRAAWRKFSDGDLDGAEFLLGQQPHESIFNVPQHRLLKWRSRFLAAAAVFFIGMGVYEMAREHVNPKSTRHLQPLRATEMEVRATLQRLERARHEAPAAWRAFDSWGHRLISMPHAELFTPAAKSNVVQVHNEPYSVLDVDELARRLQILRLYGCLEMVELRDAAFQIRAHQIRGEAPVEGRRPIPDQGRFHGLFITHGWNLLHDTWHALVCLELADALNTIDREACTAGILRFHRSKGLFADTRIKDSPLPADGRNTFYAYESLRILGALDRIKDLERWQFRIHGPSRRQGEPRVLSGEEIETWLWQERFKAVNACESLQISTDGRVRTEFSLPPADRNPNMGLLFN
jgi:RNA polymerase sigma-70 factor, ECF subfamily